VSRKSDMAASGGRVAHDGDASSTTRWTAILDRVSKGDPSAKDRLWSAVYDDLHRRAKQILWRRNASLRPTELVQEVFLRFERQRKTPRNRPHFRAIAARLMYRVLLDHLESRNRRERARVTLSEGDIPSQPALDVDALALRGAIELLETEDPRAATIVVYRFFGELTITEIAAELGLTERHVYRLWRFARARLLAELEDRAVCEA
jgi:RNA polymerase sigma factor (TIGR02999 family)